MISNMQLRKEAKSLVEKFIKEGKITPPDPGMDITDIERDRIKRSATMERQIAKKKVMANENC